MALVFSLAILSCNGKVTTQTSATRLNKDSSYKLDIKNLSVAHAINKGSQKFVKVQIDSVRNPNMVELLFEVYFQAENGKKNFLGSFSLYPSNNPGTFIVATNGQIKENGLIILTMRRPTDLTKARDVSVNVKSIMFVDE